MVDWSEVPNWKFGQIVRHSKRHGCRALVLGWESRVAFNPTESIVILLPLTPIEGAETGEIIRPYCGWWEPIEKAPAKLRVSLGGVEVDADDCRVTTGPGGGNVSVIVSDKALAAAGLKGESLYPVTIEYEGDLIGRFGVDSVHYDGTTTTLEGRSEP